MKHQNKKMKHHQKDGCGRRGMGCLCLAVLTSLAWSPVCGFWGCFGVHLGRSGAVAESHCEFTGEKAWLGLGTRCWDPRAGGNRASGFLCGKLSYNSEFIPHSF